MPPHSNEDPITVGLRLTIAYDGTHYHGWARQEGQATIQEEIETAIATILRAPMILTVAGRTDAGVHATAQVAHLDAPLTSLHALVRHATQTSCPHSIGHEGEAQRSTLDEQLDALRRRANSLLARSSNAHSPRGTSAIVITDISVAPQGFDARFSALHRRYEYAIADALAGYNPLERGYTLWHPGTLNVEAMNEAAQHLLGEHDFLSFCKPREGATTIRTLQRLDVEREAGSNRIIVTAQADAFCHSMVRSLVACLLAVGSGQRAPDWARERLQARSREGASIAPAHPLTLVEVAYPPAELLAEQARLARTTRCLEC